MNYVVTLFVASMFMVALAPAEVLPISDLGDEGVADRVLNERQAQEATSPDHRLRAVYRQTHPDARSNGRNPGHVTILDRSGRVLATRLLTEHGGRLVAVARWSPDSKFCVFTTISSDGHSPWQFEPYVFSAARRRFRFLGDGPIPGVTRPEFRFATPATVLFDTQQGLVPFQLAAPDKAPQRTAFGVAELSR